MNPYLMFALACTALALIAAVCCVIDGHHRGEADDPAHELEALAHRWATQTKEQQ